MHHKLIYILWLSCTGENSSLLVTLGETGGCTDFFFFLFTFVNSLHVAVMTKPVLFWLYAYIKTRLSSTYATHAVKFPSCSNITVCGGI